MWLRLLFLMTVSASLPPYPEPLLDENGEHTERYIEYLKNRLEPWYREWRRAYIKLNRGSSDPRYLLMRNWNGEVIEIPFYDDDSE